MTLARLLVVYGLLISVAQAKMNVVSYVFSDQHFQFEVTLQKASLQNGAAPQVEKLSLQYSPSAVGRFMGSKSVSMDLGHVTEVLYSPGIYNSGYDQYAITAGNAVVAMPRLGKSQLTLMLGSHGQVTLEFDSIKDGTLQNARVFVKTPEGSLGNPRKLRLAPQAEARCKQIANSMGSPSFYELWVQGPH